MHATCPRMHIYNHVQSSNCINSHLTQFVTKVRDPCPFQGVIALSPSMKPIAQSSGRAHHHLVASLCLGARTVRGLCRVDPRDSADCEGASGNGVPRVEHAGAKGRKKSLVECHIDMHSMKG